MKGLILTISRKVTLNPRVPPVYLIKVKTGWSIPPKGWEIRLHLGALELILLFSILLSNAAIVVYGYNLICHQCISKLDERQSQ